jgi:hypothetical protein
MPYKEIIFYNHYCFRYHMKTFRDAATVHYEVASQTFHSTLLRSPALMLFSKTDPIGTEESNKKAYENWEKLGLKVSSCNHHFFSSSLLLYGMMGHRVPRLPGFLFRNIW